MSYLTPSWINQLIESCYEIELPIDNKKRQSTKKNIDPQRTTEKTGICRNNISSICKTLNLPGSYRTNRVEVRYPMYLYTPPGPNEIPRLMSSLFRAANNIHEESKFHLQVNLGIFTAILSIHPLRDGNGRLSREIFRRMTENKVHDNQLPTRILSEIHRRDGHPFRAALCEIQTTDPDFTYHTEFMNECIHRAMDKIT